MEPEMNRQDLVGMFRKLATEIAEKDFSHISEDQKISDLGIDSLGQLELVGAMERELDVSIPDEALVGIQTVRQLLDLIEKRAK